MIIETTYNRFYRVNETCQYGLDHVWFGLEVKRSKGDWIYKTNARQQLISKAHCLRIVKE